MTNSFSSLSPREQDKALAELAGLEVLPFTVSLAAMRRVEGVIEERGLERAYTHALMDVIDAVPFDDDLWVWQALRSIPAQRAEAAWRVLST